MRNISPVLGDDFGDLIDILLKGQRLLFSIVVGTYPIAASCDFVLASLIS